MWGRLASQCSSYPPSRSYIKQQTSASLRFGGNSGASNFAFSLGEWDVSTLAQANAVLSERSYLDNFTWKAAVAVGWFELGTVFLVTVVHFALPFGECLARLRPLSASLTTNRPAQPGSTLVLSGRRGRRAHPSTTISCDRPFSHTCPPTDYPPYYPLHRQHLPPSLLRRLLCQPTVLRFCLPLSLYSVKPPSACLPSLFSLP